MGKILLHEYYPTGSKNPVSLILNEENMLSFHNNTLNHTFNINLLDGETMTEYVTGVDFKDYKIIISFNTGLKKELLTICNCISYEFPEEYSENICEGPTYVGKTEWPATGEPKVIDYVTEEFTNLNNELKLVVLSEPTQKYLYKNCINKIKFHLTEANTQNYYLKLEVLEGSITLVNEPTLITQLGVDQNLFCSKLTVNKIAGSFPSSVKIKATVTNKNNSTDTQYLIKTFYLKNC